MAGGQDPLEVNIRDPPVQNGESDPGRHRDAPAQRQPPPPARPRLGRWAVSYERGTPVSYERGTPVVTLLHNANRRRQHGLA